MKKILLILFSFFILLNAEDNNIFSEYEKINLMAICTFTKEGIVKKSKVKNVFLALTKDVKNNKNSLHIMDWDRMHNPSYVIFLDSYEYENYNSVLKLEKFVNMNESSPLIFSCQQLKMLDLVEADYNHSKYMIQDRRTKIIQLKTEGRVLYKPQLSQEILDKDYSDD